MKLAISLLLLLAGMGFGQGDGGVSRGVPYPPANAVCKDGDGNVIQCNRPCPTGKFCTMTLPPDPVDVPAVQEISKAPPDCSMSALWPSAADGWYQWGTKDVVGGTVCAPKRPYITTCKDKERGLWRSESGKYYCRKAQL